MMGRARRERVNEDVGRWRMDERERLPFKTEKYDYNKA